MKTPKQLIDEKITESEGKINEVDDLQKMNRFVTGLEVMVMKELKPAWSKYKSDPKRFAPQKNNMKQSLSGAGTLVRSALRFLDKLDK